MDGKKISKALVTLFEAKAIKDYALTLDVWVGLIQRYSLPGELVIKAIDQLITEQTPYRLEFAHLLEKVKGNDKVNITEKIEIQWREIIKKCQGNKSNIEPEAEKCFLMITDYDKYGYEGNEFTKNDWHKRWEELYRSKLESSNYKDIQISAIKIKGLLK